MNQNCDFTIRRTVFVQIELGKLSNGDGQFILSHSFLYGFQNVAVGKQNVFDTHVEHRNKVANQNSSIKFNKLIAI